MGENYPNGRKLCGVRRNCSLRCFQKNLTADKENQGLIEKGLNDLEKEAV